jgi:hypothetical protein
MNSVCRPGACIEHLDQIGRSSDRDVHPVQVLLVDTLSGL